MNMYTLMYTVEEDFLLRLLIYSNNKSRSGAPGRTRTCNPRLRRPMLYPVELRALNRGRYCTLSSWLCALNRPSIRLSSRFIAVSTIAALLIMLSIGSPVAIQAGIHARHDQGRIAGKLTQAAAQAL